MKKKRLIISLILGLVLILSVSSVALADDPTEVNINWSGSGFVGTDIDTGDAEAGFGTGGDIISGSYTATDSNNNPYSYGVDNFAAYLNAHVENGGIDTGCFRADSYAPMYGSDGQFSWSSVGVDGGSASMAYRTTTNYAQMTDASYGYQLPGGHNIIVTDADDYYIDRGIDDGRGNHGWVYADGDGDATLDCMVSGASGVWSLTFGRGGGCFTDANFNATGTAGTFEVEGQGNNSMTFNGMGISSGGGTLGFIASWVNSFSIADYSLTAN